MRAHTRHHVIVLQRMSQVVGIREEEVLCDIKELIQAHVLGLGSVSRSLVHFLGDLRPNLQKWVLTCLLLRLNGEYLGCLDGIDKIRADFANLFALSDECYVVAI